MNKEIYFIEIDFMKYGTWRVQDYVYWTRPSVEKALAQWEEHAKANNYRIVTYVRKEDTE